MTRRRIIFLAGSSLIILIFFFLSYFLWNNHLVAVQEEEERIAQEEQERIAQEEAQALQEKLVSGNVNDENLKIVFLTFNNEPSKYSEEVLNVLRDNGIHATFFVDEDDTGDLDNIYQRIVNEGHTLGDYVEGSSYILEDIEDLDTFLNSITGSTGSKIIRFPESSEYVDQEVIDEIVENGYGYFDSNVVYEDDSTTQENLNNLLNAIHSQSVSVVSLPSYVATEDPAALANTLQQLINEGYSFMTLEPTYNIVRLVEPTTETE